MPVWPLYLTLLLSAILATVPISVVRQEALICEQYSSVLFCLVPKRSHKGSVLYYHLLQLFQESLIHPGCTLTRRGQPATILKIKRITDQHAVMQHFAGKP